MLVTGTHTTAEERKLLYRKLKAERFSRYFLLIVLLGSMLMFYNIVKLFLVPVLLAAVFSTLFYPFYERLRCLFRGNASLSSFACCAILLLGLLIPVYILAAMVAQEAIAFFQVAQLEIQKIIAQGETSFFARILDSPLAKFLNLEELDWHAYLQESARTLGAWLATFINETSQGTIALITNLFVMLFTMYYFFKDGERLVQRLKYLSPLDDVYEEALILRFASVARATVKGTLLIGLIQGSLGGLTLWLFDISSPILWGVIMVVLSILPSVGAWLVMLPIAVVQIATGSVWQGLVIAFMGMVVIGNVDNLMRPRLVGRDAGMHDLMIFFSTLGGISVFGVMGFIVGPVIAVFFLTILDIYSVEFKSHLELSRESGAIEGLPARKPAARKAAVVPEPPAVDSPPDKPANPPRAQEPPPSPAVTEKAAAAGD
ncbi:MAG: AI-2E family transporter [candidate division KSB1 bacterium]|nr:AI-2E family transporter [candidate division KSB1 bacterium]MDZ7276400.1 AI-2E family transporter [candidate division KSB1 bacterium]MDZ7288071.1 AI-2E family transporter [candidate division KSB1 bacterium]MDZ7300171.1 AI-2E family transporter [candidate division KSB1 bacterium]MDZ7308829.1 AI-2E family transporter [candidate division KSB1 bacterium]